MSSVRPIRTRIVSERGSNEPLPVWSFQSSLYLANAVREYKFNFCYFLWCPKLDSNTKGNRANLVPGSCNFHDLRGRHSLNSLVQHRNSSVLVQLYFVRALLSPNTWRDKLHATNEFATSTWCYMYDTNGGVYHSRLVERATLCICIVVGATLKTDRECTFLLTGLPTVIGIAKMGCFMMSIKCTLGVQLYSEYMIFFIEWTFQVFAPRNSKPPLGCKSFDGQS